MDELIDVYNANLEHTGIMPRLEAHRDARWHRTFHCWVVNGRAPTRILFQVRSAEMVNFPNLLDVSAAGHLEAGETVADGIREVREELGIDFAAEDLHLLGDRIEVADQDNGQRNREYQAVHMVRLDVELSEYRPQVEEIAGLAWVEIDDGVALFGGSVDRIVVRGISYRRETGAWEPLERPVTKDDFLPRIQRYYLTACIMAERLVRGEMPLAIS